MAKARKRETLTHFSYRIGSELELVYMPGNRTWHCHIRGAEVKDPNDPDYLELEYGSGATPRTAMNDYARLIRGRVLVFNATNAFRVEISAPNLLRQTKN